MMFGMKELTCSPFMGLLTSPLSRRYSIGMFRREDSAPRGGIHHSAKTKIPIFKEFLT